MSFFYIWFGSFVLKSLLGIARQWDRETFAILTLVENTSTHQIVPKISLSVMSTILSPQGSNETEQQSFFFFEPRGP